MVKPSQLAIQSNPVQILMAGRPNNPIHQTKIYPHLFPSILLLFEVSFHPRSLITFTCIDSSIVFVFCPRSSLCSVFTCICLLLQIINNSSNNKYVNVHGQNDKLSCGTLYFPQMYVIGKSPLYKYARSLFIVGILFVFNFLGIGFIVGDIYRLD